MSRSYKKFPIHKDREKPKTYAKRAVRRSNGIPGGKAGYKKLYRIQGFMEKGHSPVVRRYLCRSLERLEKI